MTELDLSYIMLFLCFLFGMITIYEILSNNNLHKKITDMKTEINHLYGFLKSLNEEHRYNDEKIKDLQLRCNVLSDEILYNKKDEK